MRKTILTISFCLSALFAFTIRSNAQTLIDYWNFNVDSTVVLTPTVSIVSGASLAYAGAYYDTVEQGTTLNGVGADGTSLSAGSAALRLRNPATGPFTLTLPTTGYKNVVLAYAEERTKKGSQMNTVTYTVDGTNWINTAIASSATYWVDSTDTVSNAYQLESFDFSSDTLTNNNPNFKVRIVFSIGDSNSSGNDRFDNITLNGTPVTTGVASVSIATAGYTLYPNPVSDCMEILATLADDKSFTVINELGQNVFSGIATGNKFSINTGKLSAGNYFINIRESSTGDVRTIKFIKQ